MKLKRKTMAEIRAFERARGFDEAVEMLREAWRSKVRVTSRGRVLGGEQLWQALEPMDRRASELDGEWKAIWGPRVHGDNWPEGRKP